jgi:hypothetical protein
LAADVDEDVADDMVVDDVAATWKMTWQDVVAATWQMIWHSRGADVAATWR